MQIIAMNTKTPKTKVTDHILNQIQQSLMPPQVNAKTSSVSQVDSQVHENGEGNKRSSPKRKKKGNDDEESSREQTAMETRRMSVNVKSNIGLSKGGAGKSTKRYVPSDYDTSSEEQDFHVVDSLTKSHKVSVTPQIMMWQKNKKIMKEKTKKKSKPIVQSGEFYIGRLKGRSKAKVNTTFDDVQSFYRCECGRDYLSYMGIYRHIKTYHLQKDEMKIFEMQSYKDPILGKIVKKIILSNPKQLTCDRHASPFPNPQTVKKAVKENSQVERIQKIKLQQSNEVTADFGSQPPSNIIENISQPNQTPPIIQLPQPTQPSQPVISMTKYEKLMEDYRTLMTQLFTKQTENIKKTQQLMQENTRLYKAKEKYKARVLFLQEKIKFNQKLQMRCFNQNVEEKTTIQEESLEQQYRSGGENQKNEKQKAQQDKSLHENQKGFVLSEISLSQQDQSSQQLPEFSTFDRGYESSFSSSVFEEPKQLFANKPSDHKLSILKGLYFDPDKSNNQSRMERTFFDWEVSIKEEDAENVDSQHEEKRYGRLNPHEVGSESNEVTNKIIINKSQKNNHYKLSNRSEEHE